MGMTAAILTDIVRPLSLVLFGGDDGEEEPLWLELDAHEAFVVSYDADDSCEPTDRFLDYHWDDSEVTFNICIGRSDDLEGSELLFGADKRSASGHSRRVHVDHALGT